MKAKLKKLNENLFVIEWEEKNGEFGTITVRYDEKGGYHIDAEFISLDRVIKAIKAVEL